MVIETQGHGAPDQQVLHIGGEQHVQALVCRGEVPLKSIAPVALII